MRKYFVRVDTPHARGILCSRPRDRDHPHDCFAYAFREDAERFAARMQRDFPENSYWVSDQ